jgi:Secretion system C-terminal sorting domain
MSLKNFYIVVFITLTTLNLSAQTKILFDATKAETAGNADWVIDADLSNLSWSPSATTGGTESNAQKTPTPAQSTVTAATTETFWKGAISAWGIDCAKKGYIVESLPYNGRITFNDATNTQDLSHYKVYIVCEPNILFTASEKTAIIAFVNAGGGLFMVGDHQTSDRNGDGKDSPVIWNDLMSNNTTAVNPFGITFENNNIGNVNSNNLAPLPSNDPILHGTMGNVTQLAFHAGSSIAINKTANASAHGVVYQAGVSNTGLVGMMCAAATYGSGRVVALGDSSIPDDGSGDTNDNLFNGYSADAYASDNGRKLLMNATIWLTASTSLPLSLSDCYATENKAVNILTWESLSEKNTDWFVLERMTEKGDFEEIGRMKAAGESKEKRKYQFEDPQPFPLSYYRIKTLDLDGTFEYSKIMTIKRKDSSFYVKIKNNPITNNVLSFEITDNKSAVIKVQVFNALGTLILSKTEKILRGGDVEQLDVTALPIGVYFLNIWNENMQIMEKFCKY